MLYFFSKKGLSNNHRMAFFRLAVGLAINQTGKMDRINLIFTIHHYLSGLNLAKNPFIQQKCLYLHRYCTKCFTAREKLRFIYLRLNNKHNSELCKDFQGLLRCCEVNNLWDESLFRRAPLLQKTRAKACRAHCEQLLSVRSITGKKNCSQDKSSRLGYAIMMHQDRITHLCMQTLNQSQKQGWEVPPLKGKKVSD